MARLEFIKIAGLVTLMVLAAMVTESDIRAEGHAQPFLRPAPHVTSEVLNG